MRDVTTVVAEEKINITTVSLSNGSGQNVTLYLTIEINGLAQLSQILKKIDGVKGVLSVTRIGIEGVKPATADKPAAAPGAAEGIR
jgi:GTP pyrophosphokinase